MKIASRPQTSLRLVSKVFRKLYGIEDLLNRHIEENVRKKGEIDTLQIFFDTDIREKNFVKLLDLKCGILQAETSLDWDGFESLGLEEQQSLFLSKIRQVVMEVVGKYSLDDSGYFIAFDKTFEVLQNSDK